MSSKSRLHESCGQIMAKSKAPSIKMAPGRAGFPVRFVTVPRDDGDDATRAILMCREQPKQGEIVDFRGGYHTVIHNGELPLHSTEVIDGVEMLVPVVVLKCCREKPAEPLPLPIDPE